MSEPFVQQNPTRADHYREVLLLAVARIDGARAATELHLEMKRKEGDGVGLEYGDGICTGLLIARDVLRSMIGKQKDA